MDTTLHTKRTYWRCAAVSIILMTLVSTVPFMLLFGIEQKIIKYRENLVNILECQSECYNSDDAFYCQCCKGQNVEYDISESANWCFIERDIDDCQSEYYESECHERRESELKLLNENSESITFKLFILSNVLSTVTLIVLFITVIIEIYVKRIERKYSHVMEMMD